MEKKAAFQLEGRCEMDVLQSTELFNDRHTYSKIILAHSIGFEAPPVRGIPKTSTNSHNSTVPHHENLKQYAKDLAVDAEKPHHLLTLSWGRYTFVHCPKKW